MIENEISEKIIGCSIKVHKSLPNPATRTIEPPSQPSPKIMPPDKTREKVK